MLPAPNTYKVVQEQWSLSETQNVPAVSAELLIWWRALQQVLPLTAQLQVDFAYVQSEHPSAAENNFRFWATKAANMYL